MGDVVENKSLPIYLTVGLVIIVAGYSLARMMGQKNGWETWLLLTAGLLVIIPLHMGPPRHNENHLSFDTLERVRFSLLLISVLIMAVAAFIIIRRAPKPLNIIGLFTLLIVILTGIWDQGSSYMITSEFQAWINNGGKGNGFFDQYNYHHPWRSVARASLYALAILTGLILLRAGRIRKWTWIILALFSLTGIIFCMLAATLGQQFYVPFMVPAVALAPLYWLGIALIFTSVSPSNQIKKSPIAHPVTLLKKEKRN
jgi:hypothetical protein